MILILTYHQVLRQRVAPPEFYTIRPEDLERQLELLEQSGLHPLSPEELVGYHPPHPPSYILTFDDGTADHHEIVLPVLQKHHRRAIFFVPTSKLNTAGYLDDQRLKELHQAGQVVGLHSHEHRRLDRLGEDDIRTQMHLSQKILGELIGQRPMVFAPPGGFLNRRIQQVALEEGVRVIRTMRWGYNPKANLAALECVPINRFVQEDEFRRILAFQNMALMYAAKQLTKKILPLRVYERLRGLFFIHSAKRKTQNQKSKSNR